MSFEVSIVRLSSPAGSVTTYAYGITEDNGYVMFKQKNRWLSIHYMRGDELLPSKDRDSQVYYAYQDDFSLFQSSPREIDEHTPDYIRIPDEFSTVSQEVSKSLHAAWHGTWEDRQPRSNPLDHMNLSRMLVKYPTVADALWAKHREWETIVDAVDDGWETEQTARDVVGDVYFEAVRDHGTPDALGALAAMELCGSTTDTSSN